MRKIRNVLSLKLEARLFDERIAASLGISKGVVTKYLSLASVVSLDWLTIQTLSDTALERRVVQGRLDRPSHYVLPNYGRVHQKLRRKGLTLMLGEEPIAAHPRAADLPLMPVLPAVSTLCTASEALDAPNSTTEAKRPS